MKLLYAFGILFSVQAFSAEYYPPRISPRLLGTSQGMVGDCQSEAEINALEQAFELRNLEVKFSLFYRHAFNHRANFSTARTYHLDLNAADQALFGQAGELIPDYMWPEDGRGYRESEATRPHPSEAVAPDTDFPNTAAFGFSNPFYVMYGNYTNTRDFNFLKAQVAAGMPVVLTIQGDLLQPKDATWTPNGYTGMLDGKYTADSLKKELGDKSFHDGLDHAVTVVGFDDSLYADAGYANPGAFLVRNSWNNTNANRTVTREPFDDAERAALAKFKLKLHSINLPGFYAIPYQYVLDMAANQALQFQVMDINFVGYATSYMNIKNRYEMVTAPFTCETQNPFDSNVWFTPGRDAIKTYRNAVRIYQNPNSTADQVIVARKTIRNLSQEAARSSNNYTYGGTFSYALLSRNKAKSVDRIADLYNGKFTNYYCPSTSTVKMWPQGSVNTIPMIQNALDSLSSNVGDPQGWNLFFYSLEENHIDQIQ